ncbi:XRE family transcriptional regulator [Bizionia argentinensis JUB59]|uniref:XRE family transcriptional regulator n=1 Tax=Bizionia argentinensis JUB59 TaxID=1046627 RepID=G2E994_9FLAO|nr:helix-turn-helix transcriptional regulator [Bizionia argentinensis]EGV44879.1 XRE family transcriptional regulator [Bizionia argentinensis JUB59]
MINSNEFSKRLEKVIKFFDESASSFAEKIGVQRSSISHILSGRNKPSLDFVLKIIDAFPEVELYWLLNGKGVFPKLEDAPIQNLKSEAKFQTPLKDSSEKVSVENTSSQIPESLSQLSTDNNKDIERIVIFFKDGTFKNFNN